MKRKTIYMNGRRRTVTVRSTREYLRKGRLSGYKAADVLMEAIAGIVVFMVFMGVVLALSMIIQ